MAVTVGFLVIIGAIIIQDWGSASRAALDQDLIHYRAISFFSGQLPTPDLADYPAPSTPLYYLLFSLWDSLIGD